MGRKQCALSRSKAAQRGAAGRRQLTQLHRYSADMGTKVCHLCVEYGS